MLVSSLYAPPIPASMFPSGRVRFLIQDKLMGKIAEKPKLVHLYSWALYGILYDDKRFKGNRDED